MKLINAEYNRYEHKFYRNLSKNEEKLLMKILLTQSKSYHTEDMQEAVLDLVKRNAHMHNLRIVTSGGNIMVTKGILGEGEVYPGIAAHLDTVHPIVDIYRVLVDTISSGTASRQFFSLTGIGGDDKCGIFILLSILFSRKVEKVKAFFFVDEEVGCIGAGKAVREHKDWFSDVGYLIEADRRGSSDIILSYSGSETVSPAFKEILLTEGAKPQFTFKPAAGSISDVMKIQEDTGISSINLSCGYYNPHSADEFIDESDMLKSRDFIVHLLKKFGPTSYPHKVEKKIYTYPSLYTPGDERWMGNKDEVYTMSWIDPKDMKEYEVTVIYRGHSDTWTRKRGGFIMAGPSSPRRRGLFFNTTPLS